MLRKILVSSALLFASSAVFAINIGPVTVPAGGAEAGISGDSFSQNFFYNLQCKINNPDKNNVVMIDMNFSLRPLGEVGYNIVSLNGARVNQNRVQATLPKGISTFNIDRLWAYGQTVSDEPTNLISFYNGSATDDVTVNCTADYSPQ